MKVILIHGAMNAGKSLELIKYNYNMIQGGRKPMVLCKGSRVSGKVTSRIGVECDAHDMDELDSDNEYNIILVDECQFLDENEIDKILSYAYKIDIDVVFFGLMKDFRGKLFEGTKYIIENADSLEESTSLCDCCSNHKARYNLRLINNEIVTSGDIISIDNGEVTYKSVCAKCYRKMKFGNKILKFK